MSAKPQPWLNLSAILDEIDDYLDDRADSEDGSYGIPEANREMRLRDELRAAREKLEAAE